MVSRRYILHHQSLLFLVFGFWLAWQQASDNSNLMITAPKHHCFAQGANKQRWDGPTNPRCEAEMGASNLLECFGLFFSFLFENFKDCLEFIEIVLNFIKCLCFKNVWFFKNKSVIKKVQKCSWFSKTSVLLKIVRVIQKMLFLIKKSLKNVYLLKMFMFTKNDSVFTNILCFSNDALFLIYFHFFEKMYMFSKNVSIYKNYHFYKNVLAFKKCSFFIPNSF